MAQQVWLPSSHRNGHQFVQRSFIQGLHASVDVGGRADAAVLLSHRFVYVGRHVRNSIGQPLRGAGRNYFVLSNLCLSSLDHQKGRSAIAPDVIKTADATADEVGQSVLGSGELFAIKV